MSAEHLSDLLLMILGSAMSGIPLALALRAERREVDRLIGALEECRLAWVRRDRGALGDLRKVVRSVQEHWDPDARPEAVAGILERLEAILGEGDLP